MKNTNKVSKIQVSKIPVFGLTAIAVIVFAALLALSTTACSGGGGGKSLNSAAALKEYLDKQPANSSDKPIKIAMKANEKMLDDITEVIENSGKYVSLDLSGSPLTNYDYYDFSAGSSLTGITIGSDNPKYASEGGILYDKAKTEIVYVPKGISKVTIPNSVNSIRSECFWGRSLTSVIIPNSVKSIGDMAFYACSDLTSVTFQGTITSNNFEGNYYDDGFLVYSFPGDLRAKYLSGGIGTYTRSSDSNTWTKQ